MNSTPGVEYVTVDPSYVRENKTEDPKATMNLWFSGGIS
jgi:hypothetical protein